jgi:hypothetical protein
MLAFFFPGSAMFYAFFNLRTRYNEIRYIAERNWYHLVYFPDRTNEQAQIAFSRFLRHRVTEYCNPLELAGHSIIAGGISFLGLFFLAVQFETPQDIRPVSLGAVPHWVLSLGSAFLGALSGAYVYVFKRYRTIDIDPSTYLQAAIGMIVGTMPGGFIVTLWPGSHTSFLAFSPGSRAPRCLRRFLRISID